MKFLFRSGWGESLAIALRVLEEGNEVKLSITEKSPRTVGDGLVEKERDFPRGVAWADVIVYDGNLFDLPKEAELVRKSKPVVGSSEFGNKLEHDRPFAISLVKKLGLRIPEYKVFKGPGGFDKARQFLECCEDQNCGWVFKPCGSIEGIRTTVGRDVPEMFRMLDYLEHRWETVGDGEKVDFLLEERHEGIEVSTELWWNGSEFFLPNSTLEKNRLMDHNIGEMTGCSGNVVWLYDSMNYPLVEMVELLGPELGDKYRGPIDINAIVDREGPIFLEFTPRFGYDAVFALSELVGDMGSLLANTAMGVRYSGSMYLDRFSIGVRASIPPYPINLEEGDVAVDYPIFGWDPEKQSTHIHPCEVRLDDQGQPETSGPDGIIFGFTQTGKTIQEAKEAVYAEIDKVHVPNMRYRTDIGDDAERDFNRLEAMKYVRRPRARMVWDA